MAHSKILQLLSDGQFHSGEEIGDILGVSRAAVWKQLQKLETLDLQVESVKGRGYRLPGGLDLLDSDSIQDLLDNFSPQLDVDLEVLEEVDSTNARLLGGDHRGIARACLAEWQSAGRGRRGRQWLSPYAANIYVSLAWQFEQGAAALEGLSLAVGVVLAEALENLGIPQLQLKWPNDLFYDKQKLGGILIEMSGDASGLCQVVVGVGCNVRMPANAGENIDQAWTDLASIAKQQGVAVPTRNQIAAAFVAALAQLLGTYQSSGFAPYRERWVDRDAFAGAEIEVHIGDQVHAGEAAGVNAQGALLLNCDGELQTFNGGEVSARRVSP